MSEKDFVKTYLNLITLLLDKPAKQFFSTNDYNQLKSLGPSLPTLKFPFPKTGEAGAAGSHEQQITINCKLIKPPFKFSAEVKAPVSLSVFRFKQLLIEAVPELKNAGVQPGDLKVLIKSKVVGDSTSLSLIVDEVTTNLLATVMVTPPATKTEAPVPVEAKVSDATWAKITQLLAADIGNDLAGTLVGQFKLV